MESRKVAHIAVLGTDSTYPAQANDSETACLATDFVP